ncbi:MAG: Ion channel [Clostridiales bacterium]|nr:Ion channel [Clostridiales bacterium]
MADNSCYVILIIFVTDYFIRLFISRDKKRYFIDNIFDLIAILPFNSAFRIFRIAKLTKVFKVVKITKIAKFTKVATYSMRLFKKTRRFFDTNGFKYMVLITMTFIVIGGLLIHYVEEISFLDGIWWAFVTANTVLGRLIATVLMLTGIGLIGALTSTITTYFFIKKLIERLSMKY